ncbi:MAG: glycoside hydrolase family 15 protein [Chloroflexi bacterium]|nr:glycoside hydrolase family 15 protein [Chloroflexota bacterium]
MAYKPIGHYGLIGDRHSAALVGTDGSIDWCCFPRFDSPSVFAAILDDRNGGRFQIAPATGQASVDQSYLPNTNILSTRFTTPTGELVLTDFMPLKNGTSGSCPHEIHRIARCTAGTVEVRCTFQPRLDYARAATTIMPIKGGVMAGGNHHTLSLCSRVPMEVVDTQALSRFTLQQGEEAVFVLAYGRDRPRRIESYRTHSKLEETKAHWEETASKLTYEGLWRDQVVRSFLLLHLLVYEPTGAVVAAPTASLPGRIGGSRNWDYRYSWLRDSSFTMDVLYRIGQVDQAAAYLRWLLHQCKVTNGRTRTVYGISANSSLRETTLDHLEGYGGSRPVRIGNGAVGQLQLDVFGEVILGMYTLFSNGGVISDEAWSLVENFAEVVCNNWRRRDRGVWEVRGAEQHFVYSKMMCWATLDRAVKLAELLGRDGDSARWIQVAGEIREEVMRRGWSKRKQAFVQRYDSDSLDASNLMIPFLQFLAPDDPRLLSTVRAITKELADGPFVRRYNPEETDDGLGGEEEGAFTMLSFWLIGNLIYSGETEKARDYFEEILGCANHLGLFAEMVDPRTRQLLGNFPQAYSHIGLIHTAGNLSRALSGEPTRSDANLTAQ